MYDYLEDLFYSITVKSVWYWDNRYTTYDLSGVKSAALVSLWYKAEDYSNNKMEVDFVCKTVTKELELRGY